MALSASRSWATALSATAKSSSASQSCRSPSTVWSEEHVATASKYLRLRERTSVFILTISRNIQGVCCADRRLLKPPKDYLSLFLH